MPDVCFSATVGMNVGRDILSLHVTIRKPGTYGSIFSIRGLGPMALRRNTP